MYLNIFYEQQNIFYYYKELNYFSFLTGSYLWSIGGQTYRWHNKHLTFFVSLLWKTERLHVVGCLLNNNRLQKTLKLWWEHQWHTHLMARVTLPICSYCILMLFVILVLIRCTSTWKLFVKLLTEVEIYIAIDIKIRQLKILLTVSHFFHYLWSLNCKGGMNEIGLFCRSKIGRLKWMSVWNCESIFITSDTANLFNILNFDVICDLSTYQIRCTSTWKLL